MSHELAEAALREALERLDEAGAALRSRTPASIAEALAEAWGRLADPERALGRAAREQLPASSGLSLYGVAWALSATFARAGRSELLAAAERMAPPAGAVAAPARLSVLVLAGNVFTACVAPCSLALLARAPVLVKASSKDDVMPRLFHAALGEVDAELADACAVVTFPGSDPELAATLIARADVVSAYGSDATIGAIRARLRASTTFAPHGHGLGLGWAPRGALESAAARDAAARAFALDVAAYDQRGCLSPHAIFVERADGDDGRRFAEALARALEDAQRSVPRGALPTAVGAQQIQWRGVAEARGQLFEGDGFAVAYEASESLRISPGYRNVAVLEVPSRAAFIARLASLGVHLKAIGVAGDAGARRDLATSLPPSVAPRVCAAGTMQTPSLLALADGRLPWEGLLRFTELE